MTDILVSHEYNDNRNERIVIFHGDSLIDGVNKNGQIDIISNEDKKFSCYHVLYFAEYFESNYLDDNVLQDHISKTTNTGVTIYFMLSKYNDLIFTETTRDGESNRYGMVYIPNSISELQEEKWNQFLTRIEDFKSILVVGDFFIDKNGFVNQGIYEQVDHGEFDRIASFMNVKKDKIK